MTETVLKPETSYPVPRCGLGNDHCCFLDGVVCPFLRDDGPDQTVRRWVCTFRERHDSWEAVHSDPEYLDTVGPLMMGLTGVFCGDWPRPGETCAVCGATE